VVRRPGKTGRDNARGSGPACRVCVTAPRSRLYAAANRPRVVCAISEHVTPLSLTMPSLRRLLPAPLAPVTGARNDPVACFFWVTLSMATLAGLSASAKAAAQAGVHPFQIVFFRNLFAAVVFSPLLFVRGLSVFETGQLSTYGWRCLCALVSMLLWFTALAMIPLAELTAIGYLGPLFATLGAMLFLGEVVRRRRWTALAVGFIGAMVILRPGLSPIGLGQVLALLSTMTGGLSAIMVKHLTNRDDPNKIVFLTHLILVPMSLVPALFVWSWPSVEVLPLLCAMGLFATLGHMSLVRGFAAADASLVMTFEFSKLPFAALVAFYAFGERIDAMTWLGATIIFASAVYVTRREAQLARQRREGERS
jgi:drug/metabolite transporter (DMT)-like permease